ncbi:MAG: chromosome segregation protein SMC, partial [Bacteroidetes bacterium]
MRLKSLTLKGFKSFADETVIHFQDDVIGIVGPNGSGKSNIVDAVRWVLGEQKSRELRLDQMSSVIFNGTKKRKPGGVAQVSITFDNTRNILPTEYETLTISRLLYRSGESEYRLNGVPCRLKDITNLFMDTGIGSNSYAIIALGMVDDILADKDNARLRMFEQAAGISRYKVRKRETLNKLNQTTADLERVEDLLHEIEQNLKALEKQARRTKRFFELRDRYRQVSLELAAYRVEDLKKKQLEVRGQLEKEEDALRGLEVEITQLEAQLEAERKANLDKEKLLSERQRELNALVGRIRELENDRRMLEQRSHFVEENRRKLEEQIRTDGAKIESTTREIESFRQRLQEEKQIEATLEEQLVEAETALEAIRQEHGSLKADLDKIMQEQQQTERRLFELEKQKAVNANQVHTLRTDLERRQYDAAQRQADREALQQQLRKLESAERRARQALEELEKDEKRRRSSIQELEKQQELLRQELQNINRRLDAKRNEYQLTRSMVENLEGFPESIRFLSSHKQWKKDAPLLSDLIYVEEEYRVAIENYLEPYLNYYVVENLEEALRAIQLLNESQKGKANFFLLDAFRDYTPPIALLPEARQAIELVRCDPAYQRLVSYLLENVLITDSEERARQTPPDGVVLLSKTGHFVRRKFSVGGGSVGLFEGKKIGRKKNLEILQEEIRKLERKEQKLSGELFTLAQRLETLRTQSLPEKIQEATRELNRIGQEKVQTVTRLEALDAQLRSWQEAQEAARKRIAELEAANAAIEEDLAEQRARVAAAKQRIASTDGTYRRAAEKLSQASTEFNARNIEFIKQQNTVSALQRELAFRERALDETRAARAANEKALLAGQEELEQIATQIQELEQDLLKAYDDKKSKESRLTEAEQAYFKARGGINEIEDRIRQLNRKRNDALLLLNRLKDRLNELRLQLQSIAERLRVEFNV